MHCVTDYQEIRRKLGEFFGDSIPARLAVKGHAIRVQRNELGWSETELGQRTGVDQATIHRLECGKIKTTASFRVFALASALGLRFSEAAVLRGPLASFDIDWQKLRKDFQPLSKIRTLVRPRDWTDLRTIYHRTCLVEDTDEYTHPFVIESLDDLQSPLTALIGIAGQGKSILLRWLCLTEVEREGRVPIFIELRRLGSRSVSEMVTETVQRLLPGQGMPEASDIGMICLLFDAFDEVLAAHRLDLISEILALHHAHPTLQMVVTSRPDSGITNVPEFFRYAISQLQPEDLLPVVSKYATEEETLAIAARVDECFSKVASLMTTPLLVVLLVLHFRHNQTIPKTTIAFYKDLLDVLICRHNQSEWGLKRESEAGLDHAELSSVFEGLAFRVSSEHGDEPVHRRDMQYCMRFTLKELLHFPNVKPGLALDDIIAITNLIAVDSSICSYLHRSIREYHAAAYVAQTADAEAEDIYSRMLTEWKNWSGALDFLQYLDASRCLKLFRIPDVQRLGEPTKRNILESYSRITFQPVSENIVQVTFSESQVKCFDEFRLGSIIMGFDSSVQKIFDPNIAAHILNELSNFQTVSVDLLSRSYGEPRVTLNYDEMLSLCPNLNIEMLVEHAIEILNSEPGDQARESEYGSE